MQRYRETISHAEARRRAQGLGLTEGDILRLVGAIQYSPGEIQFIVGGYKVRYWQAVRYYRYTSGVRSNWRAFEVRLDSLPFLASWSRDQVAEQKDRIGGIMDRIMETTLGDSFPELVAGGVNLRDKLRVAIDLAHGDEIGFGEHDFGEVGTARIRYRALNEGWERGDTGEETEPGMDVDYTVTDKTGKYRQFPKTGRFYWEIPGAEEE